MIEHITKTPFGYKIMLDQTEVFVPDDPSNRHWQMIQEEIANGATVIDELVQSSIPDLSFAQLLIGLVSEQWITIEEGRAWRDRVSLPAQVKTVIDALPIEQQFVAETKALAPSIILRSDPLVSAMAAAAGRSEAEIDEFFVKYSGV